jgi:hypothetical protein
MREDGMTRYTTRKVTLPAGESIELPEGHRIVTVLRNPASKGPGPDDITVLIEITDET